MNERNETIVRIFGREVWRITRESTSPAASEPEPFGFSQVAAQVEQGPIDVWPELVPE